MPTVTVKLLPKFATDCLLGLVYNLDPSYKISITPEELLIEGPRPINALEKAVGVMEDRLRKRQASLGRTPRLPLSKKNDSNAMKQLLQTLGKRSESVDALSFVQLVKKNLASIMSSGEDLRLIEILKPEFYENNRVPGYTTTSFIKKKTYPLSSIALALCGYLGCAVGSAPVGAKDYVTVVVTPLTSSTGKGFVVNTQDIYSHRTGYDRLIDHLQQRGGMLAGLFPETALHLLMASILGSTSISVYAVREPRGSLPAQIFASMTMSLHRASAELEKHRIVGGNGATKDLHRLLEIALNPRISGSEKAAAIRYSTLLYEVLHDLRPIEEFVYTVNREFMRWVLTERDRPPEKGDKDFGLYVLQRSALGIARKLSRAI